MQRQPDATEGALPQNHLGAKVGAQGRKFRNRGKGAHAALAEVLRLQAAGHGTILSKAEGDGTQLLLQCMGREVE